MQPARSEMRSASRETIHDIQFVRDYTLTDMDRMANPETTTIPTGTRGILAITPPSKGACVLEGVSNCTCEVDGHTVIIYFAHANPWEYITRV